MARELSLSVEIDSLDAEAAIARLHTSFLKAGDSADVAAEKVEKFQKSFKDSAARTQAKKELDALAGSATHVGDAAKTAATSASQLSSMVMRFAGPAVVGAAVMKTLNWADNLTNLSRATGISTTSLQKFESIGKLSGATMDQIANASLQLSNRLAGGDKSAANAMKTLELSSAKLIAMSPDKAMLEFAAALSRVENPQQRVALAMDGLGRSAGALLPTLMDVNNEWDKTTATLSEDGVKALDDASDALDKFMDTGKGLLATVLVPFAPLLEGIFAVLTPLSKLFSAFMKDTLAPLDPNKWSQWASDLGEVARSMAYIASFGRMGSLPGTSTRLPNGAQGPLSTAEMLGLPNINADKDAAPMWAPMPTPLGVPGDPMGGLNGQSWGFMNRSLTPRIRSGGASGSNVIPFTRDQWANISAVLGPVNPLGNGGLGGFPGWANPMDPLSSLMSASRLGIGFDPNSSMVPFAGTVPMNAPGGGGGGLRGMFRGRGLQLGMLAGGLAAQYLPGRVGEVAQGAMGLAGQGAGLGAMFGPHGAAIGAGIGALVGGVSSLFGGRGRAQRNARNAETSEVFAQFSSKEFIAIQKEADRLGISMEKALNAKTMKDFGAAVDEVTAKLSEMADIEAQIADLTARTTVGFDQMNAVVQEFGLDVAALGPAFQQAKVDKEAQRIIDAMAIMEKGGADMNGVLKGMADEISALVQDSIAFGTTIPENMRPWIEKMIESGTLVDENGQKITDMSKVRFGEKMASEMDKLIAKLDELIAKLSEMAGGFSTARDNARDLANVDYPNVPDNNSTQPDGSPTGMSTGGVAGRDFRRPGHGDIFPALLRRGERVLPAGATGSGLSISVGNLSVGGGYGSRTEAVEEIGDALVSYLERRGARLVA